MFILDKENLKASTQSFLDNTGHSILDLLNDVLIDKADLEQLIDENDVINRSTKLPGLIIQSYLVLVELFDLDPMEPLHRVKVEQLEEVEVIENDHQVNLFDNESSYDSDRLSDTESSPPKKKRTTSKALSEVSAGETPKKRGRPKKEITTYEGQLEFKCDKCEKVFTSQRNLRCHKQRRHGERNLPCPHCNKMYSINKSLRQHIATVHGEKKFNCDECDFSAARQYMIKQHWNEKHSGVVFGCDICGITVSTKVNLKMHIQSVHGEKNIKCDQCPCTYAFQSQLNAHIKEAHLVDEVACDICGQVLQNPSKLVTHKRLRHPEGPRREWKCSDCDFVVSRATEPSLKIGIRSHLETHAQTKKYQCEYCDKQFRFKVGWEGHMNAHRGIYPFECQPCNKKYPSHALLGQHFLRSAAHRDDRLRKKILDSPDTQFQAEMLALEETSVEVNE